LKDLLPFLELLCKRSQPVFPSLKCGGLDPGKINYLPISNLTFISKIIEKIVACQNTLHVDSNNLLPVNQSAFRKTIAPIPSCFAYFQVYMVPWIEHKLHFWLCSMSVLPLAPHDFHNLSDLVHETLKEISLFAIIAVVSVSHFKTGLNE